MHLIPPRAGQLSKMVLLLSVLLTTSLHAELVIRGGTIHPVDPVESFVGDLFVEDGLIVRVEPSATATPPSGSQVIDATGLHIYPGMFDAFSTLGLVEVNSVSATDDRNEMGVYNPHLRAVTAIHPDSKVIPVTRANGITHALVAPSAGREGIIGGQAGVIHLDGWTVEEMTLDPSAAMVIRWPAIVTRSFDFSTFQFRETPFAEAKENSEDAQELLRQWIESARQYAFARDAGSQRLKRNLQLESLSSILEHGQRVIVSASSKRDIEAAVEFADREGLDLILAGGRDAWKVKELLADRDIPVILGPTQGLPPEDDDPYDRAFTTPGELVEAGVEIAFASAAGGRRGPGGPHSARTLPYEVGTAVAYGLDPEAALRAVTLAPAEILGLDEQLGSVQVGKIANLIITDGSPFEYTTRIRHLVIAGRRVSLENYHHELYQRYRSRPMVGSAPPMP